MSCQSANIANAGERTKQFWVYFAKTDMDELHGEEFGSLDNSLANNGNLTRMVFLHIIAM